MEIFWRTSLEEIYQNFLINLQFMSDRCELCDVSFAQGRTPNYESIAQQNLYLLRYFSAYLFEYHLAYQKLQGARFLDGAPRITSLGCGSGIDGAAAKFVFDDYSYRGIDLVRWGKWFAEEPPCIGDAGAFTPIHDNVFVFPKSLGELPGWVVDALACNLPKTSARKVCIINSRRKETASDGPACSKILQGFSSAGTIKCAQIQIRQQGNEKTGFKSDKFWFNYPPEIKQTILSLAQTCPSRPQCPQGVSPAAPCRRLGSNKLCWNGGVPMQWNPVLSDCNFCTDIYLIDRT